MSLCVCVCALVLFFFFFSWHHHCNGFWAPVKWCDIASEKCALFPFHPQIEEKLRLSRRWRVLSCWRWGDCTHRQRCPLSLSLPVSHTARAARGNTNQTSFHSHIMESLSPFFPFFLPPFPSPLQLNTFLGPLLGKSRLQPACGFLLPCGGLSDLRPDPVRELHKGPSVHLEGVCISVEHLSSSTCSWFLYYM